MSSIEGPEWRGQAGEFAVCATCPLVTEAFYFYDGKKNRCRKDRTIVNCSKKLSQSLIIRFSNKGVVYDVNGNPTTVDITYKPPGK